jgi:hypothetical protein
MVLATARNSSRSIRPFPSLSNFANMSSAPGSSSEEMPRADDARCRTGGGGTAEDEEDVGRRKR